MELEKETVKAIFCLLEQILAVSGNGQVTCAAWLIYHYIDQRFQWECEREEREKEERARARARARER